MIELLLKQMGFNAADVKKQVETAMHQAQQTIAHFDRRLCDIERKQDRILILLGDKMEMEKAQAINGAILN